MRKTILNLFGLLAISAVAVGQTTTPPPAATTPAATTAPAAPAPPAEQKITVYGFVRNDVYVNSRRNLDLRDGVLGVYPLDATNLPIRTGTSLANNLNDDLNAIPQMGYSAIITRLGVRFAGITAFGAKASGMLETDFFGITNGAPSTSGGGTENLLRLRHAYVDLDWGKTQLLVGQYWNPNFILKCFPGTAHFATGIPFNPFSFLPQVRLTHKFTPKVSLMGMVFGYDLAGFSPAGAFQSGTGVDAQKFSTLPSFAAQLGFEDKKLLAAIGLEGNTLRPRINDTQNPSTGVFGGVGAPNILKNIKTNAFALNFLAFAKLTASKVTLKAYTNYGQSYTQYVGLGGLAEYRDATSGAWNYVAQNQWNIWGELISTNSKKYQPAIFIGYLQNMGLGTAINRSNVLGTSLSFLGRGISTASSRAFKNMIRVAPRLDIYSGKMKFAIEYEFSSMQWADIDGTVPDASGNLPTSTSFKAGTGALARPFNAINHRADLVVTYNF